MTRHAAILDVHGPFGEFATSQLSVELPGLPDAARADTVAFICRRAQQIPGPLRMGVTALAVTAGVGARFLGWPRVIHFARHTHLPMIGELARLVRSLGFAYVWETWPTTRPDGSPTSEIVDA